jgi:hypothetical protein
VVYQLILAFALLGMHAAFVPAVAAAQDRSGGNGAIDPSPVPAGWTCAGNCGTDGADGVVTLSPAGNAAYEWVSTSGGTLGVGALPTGKLNGESDGSTLATPVFSATAGTALNFYFNYVTADGAEFTDYAWAELFTSAGTPVALLFTARTEQSGSIVPGTGLPAPLATLTPASIPINGGGTKWAPLGQSSGFCFATGCGYTGWVQANYVISTAGNYYLKVGVVNWLDQSYDSGLAVDGVTIGGAPIILLSGNIEVEYGTDAAKTSWLALASATDSTGVPLNMKDAATQLGFDHFNWLQIIIGDLQLQACGADPSLAGCSSDLTITGAVPFLPTADPPPGGYAYNLCPASETATDNCQSSFPAQDLRPMYLDELFSPVTDIYYKPDPSAPEYLREYRPGNTLNQMGGNSQSPGSALGFSFSDAPTTTGIVPGTTNTIESVAFVDALVGVTGSCNVLIATTCDFQIVPGTTFKWTATNGVVSPALAPAGPGSSASLTTPSRGVQEHRAKQLVDFPVNPVDLTGAELANSIISVDQFLALAGLTPQSLASIGGGISSVSAVLIPSQAAALASALADKIPPTTAATPSPGPNVNGWNNTSVTLAFNSVDNSGGSGVKQIAITLNGAQTGSVAVAGGTASAAITAQGVTTVTYFGIDNAGNQETPKTLTVRIDETSPTATATIAPAPNINGWNNTNVTVSFTGTDALSGIAACEAPISLTAEGAAQSVSGTCTDKAGNISSPAVQATVSIDLTPPEAYLRFDPVAHDVVVFGRDALSGVPPGPVAPQSVVPATRDRDDGEGEFDDDDGAVTQARTYQVLDLAGNPLTLVLKVSRNHHQIRAQVVSLQYGGGSVIILPRNSENVDWDLDDGRLTELEQEFRAGPSEEAPRVEADFELRQNETRINRSEPEPAQRLVKPGLALLRLAMSGGKLSIEY